MKKKYIKGGFTLIELLAVIVIIGLVALITVPIASNIIENSKKSGIKTSATNYIKALEEELQLRLQEEEISQNEYLINSDGTILLAGEKISLSMKGDIPTQGKVCVDENGNVKTYSVLINNHVVSKIAGEQQIEKGSYPLNITCNIYEEKVEIISPENAAICTKTKKILINYPKLEGTINEYRINAGEWKEYKNEVELNSNATIYARIKEKNTEAISSTSVYTITKIDNEPIDKGGEVQNAPIVTLSTEKPTSEVNVTFKQTDNCEIDQSTKEYGISKTKDGEYTYQTENKFSKLTNNTTYYIKTRVNDVAGNGVVESPASQITTQALGTVTINVSPEGWTQIKKITITGETTGAKLQYQLGGVDGEWISINSGYTFNLTANTSIYARLFDGTTASSAVFEVTKIDTTEPSLTLGSPIKATTKLTIPYTATDSQSGISETTCEYGTSTSYGKTGTISNNKCIITGLTEGTTYYYKVTTTNGSGISTETIGNTETGTTGVTFSSTKYPTNTEYSQYIKIKTIYTANNVSNPMYYFKTTVGTTSDVSVSECGIEENPGTCSGSTKTITANTWYKTTSDPSIKFTSNGTIYARINDGENYTTAETYTITTIDTSAPSLVLDDITKTTAKLTIPYTATDSQSGISGTTCEYGTSTNYGKTGTISNNKCIITGLTEGTIYYYKVTTTNGSGIPTEVTGNTKTGTTGVTFSPTKYPTSTEYSQYITVKTTYTADNVSNPIYYFKTTVGTTSDVSVSECGTEENPGTCSGSTKTITANTWYKTTSNPSLKFTSNGTIYARINDGENYTTAETYALTTIDTESPTCTNSISGYTLNNVTIKMNCTDNFSGISKYYYSIDNSSYVESTNSSYTFNSLHVSTIKLKVKDKADNINEYTLSDSEIKAFYNNMYTTLNNKYTNIEKNQFLISHPIGSIYVTTSSAENTAAKMASKYGGTWEVYASGKTLMGYNGSNSKFSTIESTGGYETTKLATANLPSHAHTISHTHSTPATTISSSGSHTHTTGTGKASYSLSANTTGSHTHGLSTGSSSIFVGIDTTTCSSGQPYASGYVNVTNGGYWYNVNKNLSANTASGGAHTHSLSGTVSAGSLSVGSSGAHTHTVPAMTTSSPNTTSSGSTGSGAAFSILDPYITVYMYKRVS